MRTTIFRLLLLVSVPALAAPPVHAQDKWTFTGSMNFPRTGATGTRLSNGRVLVAGGSDLAGNFLSSAEIYNPANGTWTLTSPMVHPQGGAVAVLLLDGRVLVYGGNVAGGPAGVTNLAQIFDPTTGQWTATGSMNQCRQSFTGTLLANGEAMAVGGYCGGYLSSVELYNPATGTWSFTGSLPAPVANASATFLPDGRVLVAGGTTGFAVRTAELFVPNSGTWTLTGSLNQARAWGNSYAVSGTILLNSGQVLAVGGVGGAGCGSFLSSVELYDSVAGTWAFTGSRSMALDQHRLVLLSDGRVLAMGGLATLCTMYTNAAEIYDPSSGAWSATASMNQARGQHVGTSLIGGRVLVAGGNDLSTTLNTAEIFTPACRDANGVDVEGEGDEQGDDGHKGHFRFCKRTGEMDFEEPDTGKGMRGSQMDAVTISGNTAVISGSGVLVDGTPVTYTAVVLGNANPAVGLDTFAISWTTPTGSVFHTSGPLIDGNIVVLTK